MMRKVLAGVLLSTTVGFLSGMAFAGKPERDKMAEVKPKLVERQNEVKAACGCAVTVNVKWDSYKKADDMMRIDAAAEAFAISAKNQCNSPENKKAFCDNVKSITVGYAKDVPDAVYKDKNINCSSNDMSYNGDHQFTAILDKF